MQPLKHFLATVIAHPKFKTVALTSSIILTITSVALAIIFRHALFHYFTSVINTPEHHTRGVMILAGSSIALSLGVLFGMKKLTEFLFFPSH